MLLYIDSGAVINAAAKKITVQYDTDHCNTSVIRHESIATNIFGSSNYMIMLPARVNRCPLCKDETTTCDFVDVA